MTSQALCRKILRIWCDDAVAIAEAIGHQDPSWRTEHFGFGGGSAILCGAGLYVNRALAAGFDGPVDEADWQHFEGRCRVVGVPPMVEVSPITSDALVEQLRSRGYGAVGATTALVRDLDSLSSIDPPSIRPPAIRVQAIERVGLELWQRTAAAGWGHLDPEALAASNAFTAAAAAVPDETLMVAFNSSDQPVGCASLTVREGVATLGGMSTLPEHRRNGVQSALIVHRLQLAREMGCDLAASSATPDGGSERNLIRHGFQRTFTLENYSPGAPTHVEPEN